MHITKITVALIIALIFEIVKKIIHMVVPSIVNNPIISNSISLLSAVVMVIILVFLVAFYQEEKSTKNIQIVLQFLIGCFVLLFILKLPVISRIIQYRYSRISAEIISTAKSVLYFLFILLFRKEILLVDKRLLQACNFLSLMFGIGIIKSLYSLISYSQYMISGIEANFSSLFYSMMFSVFLFTHLSFIYFLYRYYQYKLK